MKEWRYLVFLVKYHLNRWIREKKQGGVFYIGGSDVFPPPLKPEEELVLLEQLGGEEDVTVKSVLIERNLRLVVYTARKFENTGINVEDLILLRQRLRLLAKPDPYAVGGCYHIRSLYFDTPSDKALREKLDGVNGREKFRIAATTETSL